MYVGVTRFITILSMKNCYVTGFTIYSLNEYPSRNVVTIVPPGGTSSNMFPMMGRGKLDAGVLKTRLTVLVARLALIRLLEYQL